MSLVVDFTGCDSEDEIRRYLAELGVHGVDPWLVRSADVHDTYVWVTSVYPDERGRPTRRTHTTRHERVAPALKPRN